MSGRLRMLRAEAGMTLIELLAAMAIMGVLVGAFGQMLITTSKSSNRTLEQATLQDLAREAINGLARDVREATNTLGTSPVEALSGTTLTFDAPDEATPFHLRRMPAVSLCSLLPSSQLRRMPRVTSITLMLQWLRMWERSTRINRCCTFRSPLRMCRALLRT